MILYIDDDRRILSYDENVTHEDVENLLDDYTLWVDYTMSDIIPSIHSGQKLEIYIDSDLTIHFMIDNITSDINEPTQLDKIEANLDFIVMLNI